MIIQDQLSSSIQLRGWQHLLIGARIFIQNHSTTPVQWFGLEFSQVTVEKVPILLNRRAAPLVNQRAVYHQKPKE